MVLLRMLLARALEAAGYGLIVAAAWDWSEKAGLVTLGLVCLNYAYGMRG